VTGPQLISFDLTGTLARIDGQSHVEHICAVSPLPPEQVRQILREQMHLKTLPSREALTPQLIEQTCAALQIPSDQLWFDTVPLAPWALLPGAAAAVAAAAAHAPAVLLTNASVFSAPGVHAVRDELAPHLATVHASWETGVEKPDPRAFRGAAAAHGVPVQHLLHIGDSWTEDIEPVLALGGRAVWLNPHRQPAPDSVPPDRLLVATTAAEAVDLAGRHWFP